ncbi:MAG: fibronectin type III domain-containing protein [Bacteroidota bacterium]
MKRALTISLLLFFCFINNGFAQTFPVQASTTIVPPYSTYLADYVAPGSERLALNIFLADVNRPELRTRLRLRIEGQGMLIETKPEYLPPPLILQGGVPERLIATDLAGYFLPENLNFQGITRQQFERTGQLPEGLYQFCFEVLEYNRGVKVSNSACTMAWLILNDPPIINFPRQGEKLRPQDPQYITFQWTPRHTGSPNSAFSTEYEFSLVELWPETRNPNDAILTTPPIFETTTQSTTLIYGPAETPLVLGRSYAFRVRAKAMTGIDELDLFKNQGYSEAIGFIYGDACTLPANIIAEAVNSGKFSVSWEPNVNHTNFGIRYRKANDPQAEWYEETTYIQDLSVSGLQAETVYEYQVLAGCGPFFSEYSPIASITTEALPDVNYSCGLPLEDFGFENQEPLTQLNRNDIIYAGDFDVKVLEATGSSGNFSGKGTVVIPYLDNLAVSVDFTGISVNTNYRMTRGVMDVKGFGVDILSDDVTDFLDELDETLASIDDVLDDVGAGLDLADSIIGEVGDLANDILDNGPFTAEEEEELDGATVEEYLAAAKEAAEEAAGTLGGNVSVESTGKAARKVAQAIALKKRAKRLQNIYDQADSMQVIAVEFYDSENYGFDQQQYEQHRLHYDIMVTPDNESHGIPWVATKSGEQETVRARLVPSAGVLADSIVFKSGDTELPTNRNGNEWNITLPSLEKDLTLTITAINTATGATVGKLDVVGHEPISKKVNIVPVANTPFTLSGAEIQSQLNQIYKQAVASWEVEILDPLPVEGYTGTLQDDEQALLSVYSDGMRDIIRSFEALGTMNKDEFYLFIVDKSQTGKAGYMPRKHRYGFIYMDGNGNVPRTIAHELGHGAFRLQHTFEEYPTIDGQTANLMDYGSGTQLRKYQWDLIHNPPIVIGLVEDLDEGALISNNDLIIQKLLSAGANSFLQCKKCENDEPLTINPEIGGTYNLKINDEYFKCIIGELDFAGGSVELLYDIQEVDDINNDPITDHIDLNKDEFMLVVKNSGTVVPCETNSLPSEFCSSTNIGIDEEWQKAILSDLSSCLNDSDFEGNDVITYKTDQGVSYDGIKSAIVAQLQNTFYNEVKLGIKLHDQFGNSEFLAVDGVNEDNAEIKLFIKVNESDGSVQFKNINVSDEYLETLVSWLQNEANRRGIEVSVEELRKQVIADLEDSETNQNFLSKAFQSIESFFSENVGTYVEVVQTTQKTAKNIWKDGQLAESHWYSGNSDHSNWPEYGRMHELIAGPSDAVIDEIAGIPMTIKTLYGVMTDEEQRQAFSQLFTSEGMGQLIDGIKQEAEATINDDEKLTYTSSKTVVSVASMFFTGGITKAGKGLSLIESMIDGMDGLSKYKKLTEYLGEVKKIQIEKYKPEVYNLIKKHFDEVFTKFPTTHEQLEKIISFTGTDKFSDLIARLHKLKEIPGLEYVISDMGTYWTKFKGAKFVIDYVSDKGDNFIAKIRRFESPTEITLSDGTTKLRKYDIELTDGTQIEFKDWSDWKSWSDDTFKKQFVNDLANPEFTELGRLKWVFNRTNIDEVTLKDNILRVLKKADGGPIDELSSITLDRVKKLFPDDVDFITSENYLDILIDNLEKRDVFKQIFEVVN